MTDEGRWYHAPLLLLYLGLCTMVLLVHMKWNEMISDRNLLEPKVGHFITFPSSKWRQSRLSAPSLSDTTLGLVGIFGVLSTFQGLKSRMHRLHMSWAIGNTAKHREKGRFTSAGSERRIRKRVFIRTPKIFRFGENKHFMEFYQYRKKKKYSQTSLTKGCAWYGAKKGCSWTFNLTRKYSFDDISYL